MKTSIINGSEVSRLSVAIQFSGMQAQGARLPGERRYLARERSELHGLDVSRGLYDEICALRG
jgi:LDH2 family malate/lactate/ureidoglycolate dehydrogenase